MHHDKVLILDFGSQYTQLIARRVRELNIYSEIVPFNKIPESINEYKAVILSGSPNSVRGDNALHPDLSNIRGQKPLLAVCYGAQYLAHFSGGEVAPSNTREYGRANLSFIKNNENLSEFPSDKRIYVCGDSSKIINENQPVFIIREFATNYESLNSDNFKFVELGEVPIVVENAGVYFRQLFNGENYFSKIEEEHEFQHLTESNKPGRALRKGIYLADVEKEETAEQKEILHFRLLRCSSNLTGPTDNFRKTDREIITKINEAANFVFEKEAKLNHVLAQIYLNKKIIGDKPKETKAKIKAHSDKTKDMLEEGLIAFCTFYDSSNIEKLKQSESDRFDSVYKKTSGLTRLYFKLKKSVEDESLAKEFTVVLYPNSVFMIPLSTNRLYTHETRPSMLNIDMIPTRMGYVVRSSKAEALFMDNQTYLKEGSKLIKLEDMREETMQNLKNSYYEENKTENIIKYGKVHFSMNMGDYQKPIH